MVATFEYLAARSGTALLRLAEVDRVAHTLRGGGLAVLPTETGYLLAALATDEAAILRAFRVKGRDLANTMHVACSSLAMAGEFSRLTATAARIVGELTPGPITVVVNQSQRLPDRLVTVHGTVGIRVPDHPATLQIIEAVGSPITATSLNRAGEPSSSIDRHQLELLDWPADTVVQVVCDDASIRYSSPSTLVRVTGSDLEILRQGPIAESVLRAMSHGSAAMS